MTSRIMQVLCLIPSDGAAVHPHGNELREYRRQTGADELVQSKGATGIDMGAAGSGTDVEIEGATSGERKKV